MEFNMGTNTYIKEHNEKLAPKVIASLKKRHFKPYFQTGNNFLGRVYYARANRYNQISNRKRI